MVHLVLKKACFVFVTQGSTTRLKRMFRNYFGLNNIVIQYIVNTISTGSRDLVPGAEF